MSLVSCLLVLSRSLVPAKDEKASSCGCSPFALGQLYEASALRGRDFVPIESRAHVNYAFIIL